MDNIRKTPLSTDQLKAIVHAHFGSRAGLDAAVELTEGYYNTAYRLELGDGFRCVLKVAPPHSLRTLTYERNILQTEMEMMALARERTEMPVPQIYGTDTSRRLIDRDYYLMAFVEGVSLHQLRPALTVAEGAAIDREVGCLARQLNAVTGTVYGYPGQPRLQHAAWREAFSAILQAVLADGDAIGAVIPRPYAELYARAADHFAVLDEVDAPRCVHWDLWDGNIFIDPGTRRITGIIDFERALWGDPLMEATLGGMTDDIAFVQGYGRRLFDTPAKIERRKLYNLYLFLIMVIEAYYRDYVAAQITLWARGKLDETLQALGL